MSTDFVKHEVYVIEGAMSSLKNKMKIYKYKIRVRALEGTHTIKGS
jgi:hypothetical protein